MPVPARGGGSGMAGSSHDPGKTQDHQAPPWAHRYPHAPNEEKHETELLTL